MSAIAIIPARYGSTRFPGKALASETGRPLIQHVYERTKAARVQRVMVATDDQRIFDAVDTFGGEAVMTRADHPNGTSRIAEVAADLPAGTVVVNVQGDEPEIDGHHIDRAIEALRNHDAATLAAPFGPNDNPIDANIVKVVIDQRRRALYFSRSPIPYDHDGSGAATPLRHVGLYVYRREFLLRYVELAPTPLEQAEGLEQLRILEHGGTIAVALIEAAPPGIDTPQQYAQFVERWRSRT